MTPKSKAQWRVAIMRDVIKQLDLRKIIAQAGTYLHADTPHESLNQAVLRNDTAPICQVCMLGAAFLSAVRLDNKYESTFADTGSYNMHQRLKSYFTRHQRHAIEIVFECSTDPFFDKLRDEARLRFIASYIVKSKGLFAGMSPVKYSTGRTALEKAAAAFGRSEAAKA